MTNEELDNARAEEAWNIYNREHSGDVSAIAARLAREGWTPPVPVDPDIAEAKELALDWMEDALSFEDLALAGIKRGRALAAAEAKPSVVWVKHDGSRECPVPEDAWVWSKPYTSTPDPACHLNWQHVTHYAVITQPAEDVV